MAHEPRRFGFKLWVKKSCICFLHSPRTHVGDVLWNSEPDSHRQFSHCFWSAFLIFRKMSFRTESAKHIIQNNTPAGSSFWPYGKTFSNDYTFEQSVLVLMFFLDMMWCGVQTLKGKTKTKKVGRMRASHVIFLTTHTGFYFWKYFHAAQKHFTQVRSNHLRWRCD